MTKLCDSLSEVCVFVKYSTKFRLIRALLLCLSLSPKMNMIGNKYITVVFILQNKI